MTTPAIIDPDGPRVDHAGLEHIVEGIAGRLRAAGVERSDRVALLLEQGPAMALALLGTMHAAAAAPLKPTIHRGEQRRILRRLAPTAVITRSDQRDSTTFPPGVTHVTIEPSGLIDMRADGDDLPVAPVEEPSDHDVALVLHTSGTTGEPKQVPLTHGNLSASAGAIGRWYDLGGDDVSLTIMPLYHIHGIVAGLLAPISSGGSVVIPSRFDPLQFGRWLERHEPTWYTAVPTMHELILARLPSSMPSRLRFTRSSSAPLVPSLMNRLESVFDVPAIEAFGMTEAAHQIASNPLPPGVRKARSVGLPTGTEVRIVGRGGDAADPVSEGEVAVKGPSVFDGYGGTRDGVEDGWFRTGDLGRVDDDGYLFLTGRIKEMINRGGETIAPLEVEEALLDHPAVAEAAAFAVPHRWLGEVVAVAIVPAGGQPATEQELIRHARSHLTRSKVPEVVVLVDELPRTLTGKVQRNGLAEELGLGPGA